jgi:F-type H+-transporting ATPase subunit epsilon
MLKVRIINPEQQVFEGEAEMVFAPGINGTIGIMSQHTPLYAELMPGDIQITGPQEQTFPLESGILKVRNDEVVILIGL